MTYFFILGSNPALSLAELSAVFGAAKFISIGEEAAIMEIDQSLEAADAIRRLGGTVKIGRIFAESKTDKLSMLEAIKPAIKLPDGKYKFGFSFYGSHDPNLKPLAMELKKYLSELGASVRWVTSREKTLSSVVVEQNGLTKTGAEFVLLKAGNQVRIGQTLAVQAFKELSARDYGRPARDDLSGMLPPKLAQIMINLSRTKKNDVLLDPFCGSGTILSEAALMDYRNLIGSDNSEKAVKDSKKNMEWLSTSFRLQVSGLRLLIADARQLSKQLEPNSVDAIVTEPYLGPQRGRLDTRTVVRDLEDLYTISLAEFYKLLKPGGRIVMIWPVFASPQGPIMLAQKIIRGFKVVRAFPDSQNKITGLSSRQTLLYGRQGQRVWREIVILEK
jgi:tRNA (guanine10-N2)-dimethyltransferase